MSAITYNENKALFEGNVFEDEVLALRAFLQSKTKEQLSFDLTSCQDMHTAIVQQLLAFKTAYDCEFIYGDKTKTYAMALEGFCEVSEAVA
ncbi:MAG: hypothetical protein K0U47_07005 [Epsilonproteobacteria bacterium]|nr:hypothetical protein [Campylobacterota bacterium]